MKYNSLLFIIQVAVSLNTPIWGKIRKKQKNKNKDEYKMKHNENE